MYSFPSEVRWEIPTENTSIKWRFFPLFMHMQWCCCVTVCVCLSLILTHSHPHTRREGADDLVWSRLDSPLLPPLPERGHSAGDQDDSLSWKRFREDTYTLSHLQLYISTCMYIQECAYVLCSLADQIHMHNWLYLAPSPSLPPSLPLSLSP